MFSFGKPAKKKFAQQLRDAISKVSDQAMRYEAESFSLAGEGDETRRVSLANVYAEHCTLPRKDRAAHIAHLATMFATPPDDMPSDFSEAKGNLRPKIWNRSTFEFMRLEQQLKGGKAMDLPLYPLGSHLYSTLVYDTEHAMRSLSNEELDEWGASYYEGMEAALQNLDEATSAYAKIGDGFYSFTAGDSYDSSRVLLLDRIRDLDVKGDHIAMVPQRDQVFIAGSEDESSLEIMFTLTEQTIAEDPRPLSPLPLRLVDGEWVDWTPPRNHVLRKRYDELELHFLGDLYEQQKQLLEQLLDQDASDPPFVASFSGLQKEDTKELRSYCVWAQGVDSLLPRTQLITLGEDAGIAACGEWDHVASVVGDLLRQDDRFYPPRYRAESFPTTEQLEKIGKLDL